MSQKNFGRSKYGMQKVMFFADFGRELGGAVDVGVDFPTQAALNGREQSGERGE